MFRSPLTELTEGNTPYLAVYSLPAPGPYQDEIVYMTQWGEKQTYLPPK